MEPVKLATRPLPTEVADRLPAASRGARVELGDAQWLRFGDDLVYPRPGAALGRFDGGREPRRYRVARASWPDRPLAPARDHPKGRLFQREHPDVGVLVDKGPLSAGGHGPELGPETS